LSASRLPLEPQRLNVAIVGAGYVGLVTGACLAEIGHDVVCLDNDEQKIAALSTGHVPFFEPGLEDLIGKVKKRLAFGTDLAAAVVSADVIFIAVGTPPGADGAADLSSVAAVARNIGRALPTRQAPRPLVVANKSTVPVGSADYVSMLVREGAREAGRPDVAFAVVSNPEFLREGSAIYDALFPDRIVIGADSRDALDTMLTLYEPIIEQSFPSDADPRPKAAVPFITTDLVSAEMIKYAANAFLATKISFINEIAGICELVGADIANVATGIGLDSRIGPRFQNAGIGWGGSCLPKDVAALRAVAEQYGYNADLLEAAVSVNDRQRRQLVVKLQRDLRTLQGKRIALLGLTFKPNTDDLREAPSIDLARALQSHQAQVVAYDPVANALAAPLMPGVQLLEDPYEALADAHAAVLLTEWEELRTLDFERLASIMRAPKLLVDGRNALDRDAACAAGLLYRGFGRG
jgi:UDPglucose 6-dehydrogenase